MKDSITITDVRNMTTDKDIIDLTYELEKLRDEVKPITEEYNRQIELKPRDRQKEKILWDKVGESSSKAESIKAKIISSLNLK